MVPEQEIFDAVLAASDLQHLGIPEKIDFLIAKGFFLEDFGGPQFAATVNDGDFRGEFGQMQGILDGGVAAPDNGDFLVSVKGAVAGGAVGDASTREFVLAGNVQFSRLGSGAEDNGFGSEDFSVFQGNRFDVTKSDPGR